MAKPGTAKAKQILEEVMADFYVDLEGLRAKSRSQNMARAKEAFCVRCGAAKIPTVVMAEVLGITRHTIWRRGNPEVRERRNLHQRRRRASITVALSEDF